MTSRLLRAVAAATLVLSILLTGICRGEERQPERAAEIVAAVLKAYGGADAIRKIASVAATGEITELGQFRRRHQTLGNNLAGNHP
ncbi:hypothetical protein [Geobacter sp.]|uniref:hypothetical protein n=1 Tax=Geobacter sp. TaxID=46610 RepID=UPI002620A42E|nr:hypothetical protein [Geobacter sp.]